MNIIRDLKNQAGMTYIELIVVLSIFSVISSVILFNYSDFQDRVNIKNLASDIALKLVEAQKSSLSGRLPPRAMPAEWKPAYGVYFNTVPPNNKHFLYFADDGDKVFEGADCTGECLNKISIIKGNYISPEMRIYYQNGTTSLVNDLTVTFVRPDSRARFSSKGGELSTVSRAEIAVASPGGATALVVVYALGRIEIK